MCISLLLPSERVSFQFATKFQDCLFPKALGSSAFRLHFATKTHYKSVNGSNVLTRELSFIYYLSTISFLFGGEKARWKMSEVCEFEVSRQKNATHMDRLMVCLFYRVTVQFTLPQRVSNPGACDMKGTPGVRKLLSPHQHLAHAISEIERERHRQTKRKGGERQARPRTHWLSN